MRTAYDPEFCSKMGASYGNRGSGRTTKMLIGALDLVREQPHDVVMVFPHWDHAVQAFYDCVRMLDAWAPELGVLAYRPDQKNSFGRADYAIIFPPMDGRFVFTSVNASAAKYAVNARNTSVIYDHKMDEYGMPSRSLEQWDELCRIIKEIASKNM